MKLPIFSYKKVLSTNSTALRLLKNGYLSGSIISELQSRGKGQQGKKWISKKGNLFATYFFEINKKLSLKKITKFNVILIKKVISKLIKNKITIKFPNDLLINNEKVSGLLQETLYKNDKKYLILGIGINILNSPSINHYRTTYLNKYTNNKINKIKLFNLIRKKLILNKNFFLSNI